MKTKSRKNKSRIRNRKSGGASSTETPVSSPTETPVSSPTEINNKKLQVIIQLIGQNLPRKIGQSIEGVPVGDKLAKFIKLYNSLKQSINKPSLETYNKLLVLTNILGISDVIYYNAEIGKLLDKQIEMFKATEDYDEIVKKIVLYKPNTSESNSQLFSLPKLFSISTNS